MKKMNSLFDVEIIPPEERKASEFISKLKEKGFIGKNKIYLQNYINSDIGIALGHIKSAYKNYVCNGKWSEQKFEDIVLLIARDRKMLVPNTFIYYGTKYDDGKLNSEVSLERRKYELKPVDTISGQEPKVSKEEQELLDYIAKNGGM